MCLQPHRAEIERILTLHLRLSGKPTRICKVFWKISERLLVPIALSVFVRNFFTRTFALDADIKTIQ